MDYFKHLTVIDEQFNHGGTKQVNVLLMFQIAEEYPLLGAAIVGPGNQTGCIILRVGNLAD
jgi:hypothetical protein